MAEIYMQLVKGEIATLDTAHVDRIVVHSGEVWLTQDRDSEDYIVTAGAAFTLRGDGLACLQARAPTRIALLEPERRPPWRWPSFGRRISSCSDGMRCTLAAGTAPRSPRRYS